MTPQTEFLVRAAITETLAGHHSEDDRFDFKGSLPTGKSSARKVAGQLNKLRGEDAYWVVGITDGTHELTGTNQIDLNDWTQQFVSEFEDQPPRIDDEMLPVEGGMVRVLVFGGEHFPYVVKGAKAPQLEVPWREGTGTRSARRRDLLNLLVPLVETPKVRFLRATSQGDGATNALMRLEALVDYSGSRLLFFPKEWAKVEARIMYSPEAVMTIDPQEVTWGRWKTVTGGMYPERAILSRHQEPETVARIVWAQEEGIYVSGPGVLPIKVKLPWDHNAREVKGISIEWVSSDESLVVKAETEPGSIKDASPRAIVMNALGVDSE